MQLYPEYKDYNVVEVKFLDYVISNINKQGTLPGRKSIMYNCSQLA